MRKKDDANKVRVIESIRRKKEEYVQQELQFYEQQIKGIEEKSKWGWSPLYSLLALSFVNWSLMPMGAHKGGVGNHH